MFTREFYRFNEVEELVGVDAETMRQTLMRGSIPAYLEVRGRLFFYATWGGEYPKSGSTAHAQWSLERESSKEDHPWYRLTGWFQVMPACLTQAAYHDGFGRAPDLWPCDLEMIDPDTLFPGILDAFSEIAPSYGESEQAPPSLRELWFRPHDIERLRAGRAAAITKPDDAKPTKLRSDAEDNYQRVIAALWALSELDKKPHTAAKALLDEIGLWGWDKPGHDTIANVLTQSAFLAKGKHPKFG